MNIRITPGAATEDAQQIDSIVSSIEKNMDILNKAIDDTIPKGIETTWSVQIKDNWKTYYSDDIPAAMADMKQSATNLRMAVDQAVKYSSGN